MSLPLFKEFNVNEATFIPKKTKMILDSLEMDKAMLVANIIESPSYGETNQASEKAIQEINDAWMIFNNAVLKAVAPLKKNLTGV